MDSLPGGLFNPAPCLCHPRGKTRESAAVYARADQAEEGADALDVHFLPFLLDINQKLGRLGADKILNKALLLPQCHVMVAK